MKNITKMRIIHTEEYNAEAEYIKTFFEFIGILVYDEVIYSNDDIYTHLKKENDIEGVDIVLNHYADKCSIDYHNRLYLYFDLNKHICYVDNEPLFYDIDSNNQSKRDNRINALNELINSIWKDDEESKQAILQIREQYVPKNEDNDMFYIQQAIYCTDTLFNLSYIKRDNERLNENEKERAEKGRPIRGNNNRYVFNMTIYDEYITKIFFLLWRTICNLKDNDNNPYVLYTIINIYKQLLILYSYLYESDKFILFNLIEYNNQKIKLKSVNQLSELANNLLYKFPKFTKALFLKAELNDMEGKDNEEIYKYLIKESKTKLFKTYYSLIYYRLGKTYINYARNNLYESSPSFNKCIDNGNALLEQAIIINPHELDVFYDKSYYSAIEGQYKLSSSFIGKILNYISITNKPENLSITDFILLLKTYFLKAKIEINNYREHSLRNSVKFALLTAEYIEYMPLAKIIADEDEEAYNALNRYIEHSTPMWNLYCYLEPLINDITNDYGGKRILERILSRFSNPE